MKLYFRSSRCKTYRIKMPSFLQKRVKNWFIELRKKNISFFLGKSKHIYADMYNVHKCSKLRKKMELQKIFVEMR